MKCKICGKQNTDVYKIKDGVICATCIRSMTPLIRDLPRIARNLTFEQLKKTNKVLTRGTEVPFCHWENMYICEHAIQIHSWEVKLKQIKSIELDFHPHAYGNGKYKAVGDLTIKIETIKPNIKVEDVIADNVQIEYRIAGKEIKYIFPIALVNMVNRIRQAISSKNYSMGDLKEEMRLRREKREQRVRQERQQTEFDKAKDLFGINIPYSIEQLKEIRNKLIKENHPDQGGSSEKCAEINTAYDLLERFATNT